MQKKIKKNIQYIKKAQIYGDLYSRVNPDDNFDDLPFMDSNTLKIIDFSKYYKPPFSGYFTSGTTSQPKAIYYSKNDFMEINRYLKWFNDVEGLCKKERVLVLMDQFFWGIGHLTYGGHVSAGNCVVPVDTDLPSKALESIVKAVRPTIISSLPSILIQYKDVLGISSIKLIETTGEQLTNINRKKIEKYYKAKVFDSYGLTESPIGVECARHEGYHYLPDRVKLDLYDRSGSRTPDGRAGELVVSSFFHELMPIIKYKTGDRCLLIKDKCKCGLDAPRVKILGRIDRAYQLDEGYELLHKDIMSTIMKVDEKINLKDVLLKKRGSVHVLEIYTNKTTPSSNVRIKYALQNFNQEIIYMIKRKKLIIKVM